MEETNMEKPYAHSAATAFQNFYDQLHLHNQSHRQLLARVRRLRKSALAAGDVDAMLAIFDDDDVLRAFAVSAASPAVRPPTHHTLNVEPTTFRVEPRSITVELTGVEAKAAVGTLSPAIREKLPQLSGLDLALMMAVLQFFLQLLQGTPAWDRHIKGLTPQAQALERSALADAIVTGLARDFERSSASDRWVRRVSGNTLARATARANSKVIAKLPSGLDVEVIGQEERATKIRWKADDGQLREGWVFTRYLMKP